MAEITVNYVTGNGAKAQIKTQGKNFIEAAQEFAESKRFVTDSGWTEDAMLAAAAKVFAAPKDDTVKQPAGATPAPSAYASTAPSNLTCVEDGTTITAALILGKKYTAEELASGRAKKSKELGLQPAGPRCDDCWKNGGYAKLYRDLKGFKD